MCMYFKMPTQAEWAGSTGNKLPFITAAAGNADHSSVPDPLAVMCYGSGLVSFWQVNTGEIVSAGVSPTADFFDEFVQYAAWRQDGVLHAQMRSANATLSAQTPAPDDCELDFSAAQLKFGITQFGWNPAFSTFGKSKIRLYRGWAENLVLSGRNPVDVLAADWARTVQRGVFS